MGVSFFCCTFVAHILVIDNICFVPVFEREIEEYEQLRLDDQKTVDDKMGKQAWMEYNKVLFSAHSCAVEGNMFSFESCNN